MCSRPDENRFRHLPERVRLEDMVETVDARRLPVRDSAQEERDRLLHDAAG